MRLVFLAQSYSPMVSGAAIFASRLAKGMAARGHRILVITASDRGAAYLTQTENLSVLRLRSANNPWRVGQRFLLPSRREVLYALREFQPDLIHSHDPFQLGLTGITYARLPVTLSIHQLPWFVASYIPNVDGLRARVESLLWGYARWVLKKFSILITPTRTISDIVAERTGIRPQAISFGLDLRAFSASRLYPNCDGILRHKLGLPPRVPILLHVGRLDTDKRVDRVLRAAAETMKVTDAHLLLVGDGCEKSALMKLCNSLGIAERVHFPGFIMMGQGLPEIYRLASLFVTASEIETQGIVLLEAAASGLPIVAVRATCIPEIIHHGENGFLSKPGDIPALAHSMTTLIQDSELAKQMGQASYRLAQHHDQQKTMELHEELYRDLIAEKTESPLKEKFDYYPVTNPKGMA
jgi:glycosyltransferase involved in cell wall biosynthesis